MALGGGACDGIRMPGLNEKNPVYHVRVSFGEGHLADVGYTNRVGVIEGVVTKKRLAGIITCRVRGLLSRVYNVAEDQPNEKRAWKFSHHSGAIWQWEQKVCMKVTRGGDRLI